MKMLLFPLLWSGPSELRVHEKKRTRWCLGKLDLDLCVLLPVVFLRALWFRLISVSHRPTEQRRSIIAAPSQPSRSHGQSLIGTHTAPWAAMHSGKHTSKA